MSILDTIGNGFSDIGDAIGGLGDIFTPWPNPSSDPGKGVNLRYPEDLSGGGNINSSDAGSFVFNSSSAFQSSASNPYIQFQLFKPEMVYKSGPDLQDGTRNLADLPGEIVSNTLEGAETLQTDATLMKRGQLTYVPQHNIALYMTSSINITDQMHYETGSRAAAAFAADIYNSKDTDALKEDIAMAASHWGAEALTAAAGASAVFKSSGVVGKIVTSALGAAAGVANVVGDEHKRLTGKVFNPNEYLQFKNAQLRTIEFSFKFLPNSSQESRSAAEIIKTFRLAMRPKRITAVTMEAPYQCQVSFMGAGDMSQFNPCYITGASVTYNPNSASFFRKDGNPVEIDLNLQLSEIYPLYRDDIEDAGGMHGPSAQGFSQEKASFKALGGE